MSHLCEKCVLQKKQSLTCICNTDKKSEIVKVNIQTVFLTFPKSKLEFQSIELVRVFEPEEIGTLKILTFPDECITIDSYGTCESLDIKTGIKRMWFTRPQIQSAITMKMNEGVGGFFYQFHSDGSITSNSSGGSYFWGSIEEKEMPYTVHMERSPSRYFSYPIDLAVMHLEGMIWVV